MKTTEQNQAPDGDSLYLAMSSIDQNQSNLIIQQDNVLQIDLSEVAKIAYTFDESNPQHPWVELDYFDTGTFIASYDISSSSYQDMLNWVTPDSVIITGQHQEPAIAN